MKVVQTRTFKRQISKPDDEQQDILDDIIWKLSLDPTMGQQRPNRLRRYWFYDYQDSQGRMQLHYQFDQETLQLCGVFKISQFI